MKERKTIFPKNYFSSAESKQTIDEVIGSKLKFWDSIAKKQNISDKMTFFLIFDLPDNSSIFEWFLQDATIENIREFVAYQTNKKSNEIKLFFETKEIIENSFKLNQIIPNNNQIFRKRYYFDVEYTT